MTPASKRGLRPAALHRDLTEIFRVRNHEGVPFSELDTSFPKEQPLNLEAGIRVLNVTHAYLNNFGLDPKESFYKNIRQILKREDRLNTYELRRQKKLG